MARYNSLVSIFEATELPDDVQDSLRESDQEFPAQEASILGPLVVVSRHKAAYGPDGSGMYGVNATYIEGYTNDGTLVDVRSLQERSSPIGRVQQAVTEKWKVARVKRAVARSAGAVSIEHTMA